ncbi:MAG TPA: hypothetical protein VHL08_03330 [Dongiaceae bacterium]|jgi:hypothetical protein|nr:hypothetical protein [Dongiaceae bacterium]
MTKKMAFALSCAACLVGAKVSLATPADFGRYHEAIRVAELCSSSTINDETRMGSMGSWYKMSDYIARKAGDNLTVGTKLSLIQQAKMDAWDLVEKYGCGSPEAQPYLALYNTELSRL